MSYEIWKTLFTQDFNCNNYIYHYTNIDNALQIISSNTLLFSDLNITNDFPEEKVSIDYIPFKSNIDNNKIDSILDFLHRRSKLIQLICFCKDEHLSKKTINELSSKIRDFETIKFFNVTGRGFANPLMWSKYNNTGVCLVINKKTFEQNLKMDVSSFDSQSVTYLESNKSYTIKNPDELSESYLWIRKQKRHIINLMRNEKTYVEYNFFYKRADWKKENEYRYVAFKRKSEDLISVGNVHRFLEGIVINKGSIISNSELAELSHNGNYPIKKIEFSNGQCYIIS